MGDKTNDLLQKAASIAHHLGKMMKANNSFHEHMKKISMAHHADMHKAIGHMHKLVGIEPEEASVYGTGGDEPKSTDLEGAGTHNLQNFGASGSSDAAKAATGGDMNKNDGQYVTKTDLQDFANTFMETFLKAVGGEPEGNNGSPFVPSTVAAAPFIKAAPAAGIGNRNNIPVQTGPTGVNKSADNGQAVTEAPLVLTPALAKAAMENPSSPEALAFMKASRPMNGIPDTLASALSRTH